MVFDVVLEFLSWQWSVNWLFICLVTALVIYVIDLAVFILLLPLWLFPSGRRFARDVFKELARAASACVRSGVDGFT